jgi:hypothetical protein
MKRVAWIAAAAIAYVSFGLAWHMWSIWPLVVGVVGAATWDIWKRVRR